MGSTERIHPSDHDLAKTMTIVAAPLECEVTVVARPKGCELAPPRGHGDDIV